MNHFDEVAGHFRQSTCFPVDPVDGPESPCLPGQGGEGKPEARRSTFDPAGNLEGNRLSGQVGFGGFLVDRENGGPGSGRQVHLREDRLEFRFQLAPSNCQTMLIVCRESLGEVDRNRNPRFQFVVLLDLENCDAGTRQRTDRHPFLGDDPVERSGKNAVLQVGFDAFEIGFGRAVALGRGSAFRGRLGGGLVERLLDLATLLLEPIRFEFRQRVAFAHAIARVHEHLRDPSSPGKAKLHGLSRPDDAGVGPLDIVVG